MEPLASAATPMRPPEWTQRARRTESDGTGVSWAAVIGGAVVTAALSLILLSLGAGLGLSAVSPWSGLGASTAAISKSAIIWLIVMQVISGSMGGYLAGRLRTRWAGIHNDEVYFRDTAHGFLAWGLALVVTAAFLATAATFMVGAAVAKPAGPAVAAEGQSLDPNAYYVDMLFRPVGTAPDSNAVASVLPVVTGAGPATRGEASRIFVKALTPHFSAADRSYLDQLISSGTGLGQPAADKRLTDVITMAQDAAEAVRKAVAHSLLWIFVALLIGAFCASFAATIGGRQRDDVVLV